MHGQDTTFGGPWRGAPHTGTTVMHLSHQHIGKQLAKVCECVAHTSVPL